MSIEERISEIHELAMSLDRRLKDPSNVPGWIKELHFTTDQVGQVLGLSTQAVRARMRAGKMEHLKHGSDYRMSYEQLMKYAKSQIL